MSIANAKKKTAKGRRFSAPLFCATLALLAAISGLCSCAGAPEAYRGRLRFALTASTFPESPFIGKNEALPALFQKLNEENPLFLVHAGDIVHGGKSWMGIAPKDLERQYRNFREASFAFRPLLFTVKGEKDVLDDNGEQYSRHMGRKFWYSFNYGPLHFIVLDTCDPVPCSMGPAQMAWLKTDLRRYRRHPAIFVFAYHPPGKSPVESGANDENADCPGLAPLHGLFLKYPVKAVFTGRGGAFFEEKKDKILYVSAGCDFAGLSSRSGARRRGANQYYIVEYRDDELTIREGKLD